MKTEKIYLASSWKNKLQPAMVELLRSQGYEVYDFKNPSSGGASPGTGPETGFGWRQCDPTWGDGRGDQIARYREMLKSERAEEAFQADFGSMKWADTCVLLLPSGRSAHIEAGWMAGAGKRLIVYLPLLASKCATCGGGGWLMSDDRFRNELCGSCGGLGKITLWDFEPELMYLVGGLADVVIAHSEEELLSLLRDEWKLPVSKPSAHGADFGVQWETEYPELWLMTCRSCKHVGVWPQDEMATYTCSGCDLTYTKRI